jgi:hypothetical protein
MSTVSMSGRRLPAAPRDVARDRVVSARLGDADLYRKIVELQAEVVQQAGENFQLKKQVKELEESIAFSGKLTYKAPYYFAENDFTPYCPTCWEDHRKAVHLARSPATTWITCGRCHSAFTTSY